MNARIVFALASVEAEPADQTPFWLAFIVIEAVACGMWLIVGSLTWLTWSYLTNPTPTSLPWLKILTTTAVILFAVGCMLICRTNIEAVVLAISVAILSDLGKLGGTSLIGKAWCQKTSRRNQTRKGWRRGFRAVRDAVHPERARQRGGKP